MFKPVKFRSANGYDTNEASDESAISEFEPTLTIQSEKDNCDINVILERFNVGVPAPLNKLPPIELEWDQAGNFQDSMNLIVAAREAFMEIPAKVRARFHNDPAEYLDFVYNDDNREEAILLGLIPKPEATEESSSSSVDSGSTSDSASDS